MEKKGYIYGLINPIDKTIFYIGRTIRPVKKRVEQHIKGCDRRNIEKCEIIDHIIDQGFDVDWVILEEITAPTSSINYNLLILEKQYINFFKNLTNRQVG